MSTGPDHPPLSLLACEFVVPNQEVLLVPYLNEDSDDQAQTFATVGTLPYALRNYTFDQLKKDCKVHIETISSEEYISADSPTLESELLQAICRFQVSDPIARQASTYIC